MQMIEPILILKIGCLAGLPSKLFFEIAARTYGWKSKAAQSGSRSCRHLPNLKQGVNRNWCESGKNCRICGVSTVNQTSAPEDVVPGEA